MSNQLNLLTDEEKRKVNAAYLIEPPAAQVVREFADALQNEREKTARLQHENDELRRKL